MKRISVCLLCLIILVGCGFSQTNNTAETHSRVTVNVPKDSTVNGYRTAESSAKSPSKTGMPQILNADEIGITASAPKAETAYYGNKNSKVFHSPGCEALAKMKSSNKVKFSTRDECVSSGYKPCSICNP